MNSDEAFLYFQTLDDHSSDEEIDDNESDFEPNMFMVAVCKVHLCRGHCFAKLHENLN